MKHYILSFFLLISTLQLIAQQRDYYDCVAYGYKGHVKQGQFFDSNPHSGWRVDYYKGYVTFNKDGSYNNLQGRYKRDNNGYLVYDSISDREYIYKDNRIYKVTYFSYDGLRNQYKYIDEVLTYTYNDKGQVTQQKKLYVDWSDDYSYIYDSKYQRDDTTIQTYSYSNIIEDFEGNWISRSYTMTDNKGHHESGTQRREIKYYWSESTSPMSKDNRKREKLDEIQFNNIDMALKYGDDLYKITANILFSLEEIAPRGSGEYHMVVRIQNVSNGEDFMHEDFPVKGSTFKYSDNKDYIEYYFSINSTKLSFKLKNKLHNYKEPSQLDIRGIDDNNPDKEIIFMCGLNIDNEKYIFSDTPNPIREFFNNCHKRFSK